MSESKHGQLNAKTGRTYPPPLTEGHELPPMPHVEDLIADGHIPERVRLAVEIATRICDTGAVCGKHDAILTAIAWIERAMEWDRHERLR